MKRTELQQKILLVNTWTKVHKNLWFVAARWCCRRSKFNEKPIKVLEPLSLSEEHLFGNGKWVTDKCQSEYIISLRQLYMIHPTVLCRKTASSWMCILDSRKKPISLISYAKSDFSVNKNLKREEEASDTDAAISTLNQ